MASTEVAPALAARAYERAAALTEDPEDAARWLDLALARAPRATTARWRRVAARLSLGRLDDALADVGHLEALAHGVSAKHAVWLRAGRAWQRAGLRTRAGTIFERALRYAPDDGQALGGLGEALVAEGAVSRGVSVLVHALALARERGEATGPILLPLARAFAEGLDDLPDAIAHVVAVPIDAGEAPTARGLEARWRARLGDHAGASLAFARLREIAASLAIAPERPRASANREDAERLGAIVDFLLEAAEFETTQRIDVLAAQRHLTVALRLRPHDAHVQRAYRAAYVTNDLLPETRDEKAAASDPSPALPSLGGADEDAIDPSDEDIVRAARADELARRVQADPADDAAADELASLLEALGRGHELLALLSARLEDAPADRRDALAARVRVVLDRLATVAEAAGRSDEAGLYRSVLDALRS